MQDFLNKIEELKAECAKLSEELTQIRTGNSNLYADIKDVKLFGSEKFLRSIESHLCASDEPRN